MIVQGGSPEKHTAGSLGGAVPCHYPALVGQRASGQAVAVVVLAELYGAALGLPLAATQYLHQLL